MTRESKDDKVIEVPEEDNAADHGSGVSPEGVPYQGPSHNWELEDITGGPPAK